MTFQHSKQRNLNRVSPIKLMMFITLKKPSKYNPEREYTYAGEGKPFTVPENSYFVMGDSRNRSLDSRYWGVVDRDLVVGRAMFVYWSCDRGASNGKYARLFNKSAPQPHRQNDQITFVSCTFVHVVIFFLPMTKD